MATSDILGYAIGEGANVMDQTTYEAQTDIQQNGLDNGAVVPAVLFNKVLRQSSFLAAGLAQFCADQDISIVDDGDIAGLATDISNAIVAAASSGGIDLSGYVHFPAGTVMLFAQDSAPTGWTQITTGIANDRYLRVVNDGSGGSSGGTVSPIVGVTKVPTHSHSVSGTTSSYSESHAHDAPSNVLTTDHADFSVPAVGGVVFGINTNQTGTVSSTHSHTFSATTGSPTNSGNTIFKYANVIMCSFDG